jgi:LysM repeat protein
MSRLNFLFSIFVLIAFSYSFSQEKSITSEYAENWKDVAINQMVVYGVPASITLAQGILESGHGKSKLALKANNHFGIKCNNWNGETFFQDDDAPNECFRKYTDASASFKDHSIFLSQNTRYAELFELNITDYKAWAKGLKNAGYATNPKYHRLLIDIIEKYELDQYDKEGDVDWVTLKQKNIRVNDNYHIQDQEVEIVNNEQLALINEVILPRKTFYNPNKTKYVIAKDDDTFYQIAKEFGVSIRQLHKWNDFPPSKDLLSAGDKVYIMRKRSASFLTDGYIRVDESAPLWKVSQEYGVQLSSLIKFNNSLSSKTNIQKGDVVLLK